MMTMTTTTEEWLLLLGNAISLLTEAHSPADIVRLTFDYSRCPHCGSTHAAVDIWGNGRNLIGLTK
jgi:hypothetical protein